MEKQMDSATRMAKAGWDFLPWAKGQSAVVAELRCQAQILRLAGDRAGAQYVGTLALRMELADADRFESIRAIALEGILGNPVRV